MTMNLLLYYWVVSHESSTLFPHRSEQIILRPEWHGDLNHFIVNLLGTAVRNQK